MKNLKLFETHQQYEAAESSLILPNVSFCLDTPNVVHYNPYVSVTGVELNKSTLKLDKGVTETLVATVLPANASNKGVTWSSSDDSVATVSNNGLVTAVGDSGNATITVTTVDGGFTAQCAFSINDPYNGHEYVKIGSIKWATMNVGATAVTDSGLYFQWGDTQGYTADQVTGSATPHKDFSFADYELGDGGSSASNMTKYNSSDGKTVLEAVDDAASVNMGGSWRMPTTAEFQALSAATTSAWTADYEGSGVAGLVLTSKADSTIKLFFPAVGFCYDGNVSNVGGNGSYWSNKLDDLDAKYAKKFDFTDSNVFWYRSSARRGGCPVRGVVG